MGNETNYSTLQRAPSVYNSKSAGWGYPTPGVSGIPSSNLVLVSGKHNDEPIADFNTFYKDHLNKHYGASLEDSTYTRTRDFYTLLSYNKAFGKKEDGWNPELGFKQNEGIIRKLYDYYQNTYTTKPNLFLWAGLGRMAGGAILGGLLGPGTPDPTFLTKTMVLIGKVIFLDLAWQHELFLADPNKAITTAREHDLRFPAKAKYEIAWSKIATHTSAEVAAGNLMLLQNEQFSIVQPFYDAIKNSSEFLTPWFFSRTSAVTQNVHPYHLPFLESFPTTNKVDITLAADRWRWITMMDGMWDKWIKIPADERSRLVNLSLANLLTRKWGPLQSQFVPPGANMN